MTKINFTKQHFDKLCAGLLSMVLNNITIPTKMGTPLNVLELLHTTSINTLNNIRLNLNKQIENLENQDEWVASATSQAALNDAKKTKETINLIIGYKRYLLEQTEANKKKQELETKLAELKESQKTPEEKMKEIEDELAHLQTSEL